MKGGMMGVLTILRASLVPIIEIAMARLLQSFATTVRKNSI